MTSMRFLSSPRMRTLPRIVLWLLIVSTASSPSSAWTLPAIPRSVPKIFPASRGFHYPYGAANNSTIPNPDEVAARLNVQPFTRAPKWVWKYAWRGHGRLLKILHWKDPAAAKDVDQSLKVVWLKALAAFNPKSPVYDAERWTFNMLPQVSAWLIFRLIPSRLFPRLHHANIELRTTYLDSMILKEISASTNKRIRLISLGAGYDVRSVRWLSSGQVDEAWELDIPTVVESKRIMLERLQRRRQRRNQTTVLPSCRSVDLNNLSQVQEILQDILTDKHSSSSSNDQEWHTIFVSEGVLIYLDPTIPGKLLKLCADTVTGGTATASLCMADRLENSPGGEEIAGRQELARASWDLTDWCPKPGLARHMAVARLFPSDS
jgi:O-methyltransferase involved in polyketide biosynthesis